MKHNSGKRLAAALIALLPVYALATRQAKLCLPKKKYGYLFLLFALTILPLRYWTRSRA